MKVTTIWDHRLHKIDDERNGCGIGKRWDENIVKKGLILFVGPSKTGKYVIHNPERGRDCCVFDVGGERSSVTQRVIRQGVFWKLEGDMTKSLTKSLTKLGTSSDVVNDVVNDVVLHMSITKEGSYG